MILVNSYILYFNDEFVPIDCHPKISKHGFNQLVLSFFTDVFDSENKNGGTFLQYSVNNHVIV